jgi:hypothetical protein
MGESAVTGTKQWAREGRQVVRSWARPPSGTMEWMWGGTGVAVVVPPPWGGVGLTLGTRPMAAGILDAVVLATVVAGLEAIAVRPGTAVADGVDVSTLFRTHNPIGFQSLLIGKRSEVAIRCMTALAVIEHFDVCKHSCLGLLVRLKILQIDQFGF